MRHHEFLRGRYKLILRYTGLIWFVIALILLSPLLSLIFFREEVSLAWGFLVPGVGLALTGLILWKWPLRIQDINLTVLEGTVIVVLSWLAALIVGAIPFMLVGGLNFTQAFFESTSGWTTTGLSVVDVNEASHLILLYRSTMQLAGGAGFAIIVLATLTGPTGIGLSSAEGREQQLAPNVRQSAGLVLSIYIGYVVLGILGLRLLGMNWFDAVNHSFAALSTGGFSTKPDSIGYWDSPALEAFVIVLMLLGTTSFLTHYALVRGRFKTAVRTSELRFMGLLLVVFIPVIFLGLALGLYPSLTKAVRVAVFEVVTAVSTTGFSTVGYLDWSALGWLVLIVLMLIGGGAGSTAGGIKQYRVLVLLQTLIWEVRRWFLPSTAVAEPRLLQTNRHHFLSDTQVRQVGAFITLYVSTFLVGSAVIAAHGYSLPESLFEFASTIGTVGLSIGVTAADAPVTLLWAQIVGMMLGRLEFFALIVGLIKLLGDLSVVLSRPDRDVEILWQSSHPARGFLVLVPVANRTHVQQLGHLGSLLAHGHNGELLMLNVIQVAPVLSLLTGRIRLAERRKLVEAVHEVKHDHSVPVHTMVRLARQVPDGIRKTVENSGCDLVLFGWPETIMQGDSLFGTAIDPIVANPPCDIGIVRPRPLDKLHTIVVPVAGRANERLAIRTATSLAQSTPETTIVRLVYVPSLQMEQTTAKEHAASVFAQASELISAPYHTQIVTASSSAEGILQAAHGCDLIIIGATKEPLFRNLLIGNVAKTVAENAACTVMVMKKRSDPLRSILRETVLEPVRHSTKQPPV